MTMPGNPEKYYDPWKDYNETILGIEHDYIRPLSRVITPIARPIGLTIRSLGTAASLVGTVASHGVPLFLTYELIKDAERKREAVRTAVKNVELARTRRGPKSLPPTGLRTDLQDDEVDISDQIYGEPTDEDTEQQTQPVQPPQPSRGYTEFLEKLKAQGRVSVRPTDREPPREQPEKTPIEPPERRDDKREHRSREAQRVSRIFERIKPPANLTKIPYISSKIGAIKDMDTAAPTVAQSINKYGVAKAIASLRESDDFKPGGKFYDLTRMFEDPKDIKWRLKRMARYQPPDYKTSTDPVETYKDDYRAITKMYIPEEFYQFLPDPVVRVLKDTPRAPKPTINSRKAEEAINAYRKRVPYNQRK